MLTLQVPCRNLWREVNILKWAFEVKFGSECPFLERTLLIALLDGDCDSRTFVGFDGEGASSVEGGVAAAIDGDFDIDASITGSDVLLFVTAILEGDARTFTDAQRGLVERIDIAGRTFAFFDVDRRTRSATAAAAAGTASTVTATSGQNEGEHE